MLRKIRTQQEIEKKKKQNQTIVGIILVVLIGVSSLGYAIMSREDGATQQTATYAGLKFYSSNGFWALKFNEKIFYFSNLPQNVSEVQIEGNYSLSDYYNKPTYFVNQNQAASNIYTILNGLSTRVQEACISGMNCTDITLPIKNCETDNVFVFKESSTTRVSKVGNCVFIEGDFFSATDKLVYRFLNIA